MKIFFKKYFSTLLCLVLIGFVIHKKWPVWQNSYRQKGANFNKVAVINLDGGTVQLPLQNKKAVYIFWTTWCGPCHAQMDLFRKSIEAGKLNGESIIAVNLGEPTQKVKQFQKEKKFPFKIVISPPQVTWDSYSVMVTPTIAYVSADGIITKFSSGLSPLASFHSERFLR